MDTYPYKAEEFLAEARAAVTRMRDAKSVPDLNKAFLSFLNASNFVFQSWPHDFKVLLGFDAWWKSKGESLKNDVLCAFFRKLRNDVTKAGFEPFKIHGIEIDHLASEGPMQIGFQRGVMIGETDNEKYVWKPAPAERTRTAVGFTRKPACFETLDPIQICEKYLDILSGIIDEFKMTFK